MAAVAAPAAAPVQIDLSSPDAGAAWQPTWIDLDALSDSELVHPPSASIRSARRRRKRRRAQPIELNSSSDVEVLDDEVRFVGGSAAERDPLGGAQRSAFQQQRRRRAGAGATAADGAIRIDSDGEASGAAGSGAGAGLIGGSAAAGGSSDDVAAAAAAAAFDAQEDEQDSCSCGICLDDELPQRSMYQLDCRHEFCRACLRQHVMMSVDQQKMLPRCPQPDCKAGISADAVRGLLSRREWGAVLDVAAEASLPAEEKIYCPYAECSALLVMGPDFGRAGDSACPHCNKKLCGECGKLPHPGADCAAAAAGAHLSSDADVLKLAEEKHWRQCPKCRCMVERLTGCNFMTCAYRGCGTSFCYKCGKAADKTMHTNHFACCR